MTEIEYWDFDDADEMADAVAGDVAFIIESALDARGQAILAFPGGSSPFPIYERLAEKKLNWKKVIIVPTDDRMVALDDPLCNIAKIARIFLPLGARVVPLNSDAKDYRLAGSAADARLKDLPWPLDLVWLGMGVDGHTASIFPGPDYEAALNADKDTRMIGVMPDPLPPEAPVARFTLTRQAIGQARTVLLTIAGDDKKSVLDAAIKKGDKSDKPIGRVLAALDVPVDIYYLEG